MACLFFRATDSGALLTGGVRLPAWKTKKPSSLTPVETRSSFGEPGTPYGVGVRLDGSLCRFPHPAMRNTVQDLPSPCQEVNKDFSNSAGDHTTVGCNSVGGALSPGAGGQGDAQCGKDTFGHLLICQSPSFRGVSGARCVQSRLVAHPRPKSPL